MAGSELTPQQRVELLKLARETLYRFLSRGQTPKPTVTDPVLNERRGVFVSLHVGERLRGCIGTFSPSAPLFETVMEMAVAAATSDVRFAPLRPDELSRVDIEISVLSPLTPISPEDVEVGRHGIFVTRDRRRGVLLPQVATQYGWDRETFLDQTCLMAGLPKDAWKDPSTVVEEFTADVFSETTVDWD
jgi:AmmeMemoRadiSam system protein A